MLATYTQLRQVVDDATPDEQDRSALESFETAFFNTMTLDLDRYFVHRLRMVTGKDGNPLNEVEMITDSLMNNDGTLRAGNVIRYAPEESVVKLRVGDPIRLTDAARHPESARNGPNG